MGRRNDKAREQSKAAERTGRATAVDGTRSEVMAGVGKGGTGFKGNAGGGWHSIRTGEHSRSDTCVISAWVTIVGDTMRGAGQRVGSTSWEK